MAISKILPGDTLGSGFRVKYNDTVDKLITGGSLLSNLTLRLNLFDGNSLNVALSNFIYSKAQVNALIASPLQPPTDINCSTNPLYPYSNAGTTLYVTAAGKIGGADGKSVQIGDLIICKENMTPIGEIDGPQSEAECGTKWFVVEGNKDYATETVAGIIQIATQAEVNTGTNATKAVTPLTLETRFDAKLAGTPGKIVKFIEGAVGDSIVSESGGVITISTGVANTQPLLATDGTQGLRIGAYAGGLGYGAIYPQSVTPDGSNFTLVALDTRTFLNAPLSGTVDFGINSSVKMSLSATELITFGATDTGEAHIFGGSARVNGNILASQSGVSVYLNPAYETGYAGVQVSSAHGLQFATSNITRLSIETDGQIITNLASDTGEHFIVGGSARINANLMIASSIPYLAFTDTSNGALHSIEGNDSGITFYADINNIAANSSFEWRLDGGGNSMTLSATELITFGATDTGEAHIFGGSARINGGLVTKGNIQINKATPVIELWNEITANGAYSVAVTAGNVFRIQNDFAGTTPMQINGSNETTFSGTVESNGFILGNGEYLKCYRDSGALLIDVLGIEPGTDNTRLQITGDFNIKNGAGTSLMNMNTSGSATFIDSLSWGTNGNKYMFGAGGTQKFGYTISGHNILYSGGVTGLSIYNSSDTTPLMRVLDNGNVLINTVTDNTIDKQQINGSVGSTQYYNIYLGGFAHGVTNKLGTDQITYYGKYSNNGGGYIVSVQKATNENAVLIDGVFVNDPLDATAAIQLDAGLKSGAGVTALGDGKKLYSIKNAGTEKFFVLGDGRTGGADPTDGVHFVTKQYGEANLRGNTLNTAYINEEISAAVKKYFKKGGQKLEVDLGAIAVGDGLEIDFNIDNPLLYTMEAGIDFDDTVNLYQILASSGSLVNSKSYISRTIVHRIDADSYAIQAEIKRTSAGTGVPADVAIHTEILFPDEPNLLKMWVWYDIDHVGEAVNNVSVPFVKTRKY